MKKEIKDAATNDLANAFIWSAFKYFLRHKFDSYIIFLPIKYYKSQHLISKKFMDGYALNRRHFHAPTDACVSLIWWANEDDATSTQIPLKAIDIVDDKMENQGELVAKKCFNMISSKFYEGNRAGDIKVGILCDLNGRESNSSHNKKLSATAYFNNNKKDGIIGYLAVDSFGLDNPRLHSCLTIGTKFNGHGFYLTQMNFALMGIL